jgi:hypothetical protein
MSETTSFLGGAALAGLAAVILLKGGVSTNSPIVSPSQPLAPYPYPTISPSPLNTVPPAASGTPTIEDLEKQRLETERLKVVLEQQRVQTEQLKTQIQSQQTLIDSLNNQVKNSAAPAVPKAIAGGSGLEQNHPIFTGLLWALGGITLAFGGGIALVGMFALFAKQQRPSRTIEVIHDEYPGYLPTRRRTTQQVLPPRRNLRRVEAEDLD